VRRPVHVGASAESRASSSLSPGRGRQALGPLRCPPARARKVAQGGRVGERLGGRARASSPGRTPARSAGPPRMGATTSRRPLLAPISRPTPCTSPSLDTRKSAYSLPRAPPGARSCLTTEANLQPACTSPACRLSPLLLAMPPRESAGHESTASAPHGGTYCRPEPGIKVLPARDTNPLSTWV